MVHSVASKSADTFVSTSQVRDGGGCGMQVGVAATSQVRVCGMEVSVYRLGTVVGVAYRWAWSPLHRLGTVVGVACRWAWPPLHRLGTVVGVAYRWAWSP